MGLELKDWRGRPRPSPLHVLVFSKFITLRNGRKLFAEHYGLNAFAFWALPRS